MYLKNVSIRNPISFRRFDLLLGIFILSAGCQPLSSVQTEQVETGFIEQIALPLDIDDEAYKELSKKNAVTNVYFYNDYKPLWLHGFQISAAGDSLLSVIQSSRRLGLLPQQYHLKEISNLYMASRDTTSTIRLEVLLTDAFFKMISDVRHGRTKPSALEEDSILAQKFKNGLAASEIKKVVESNEPSRKEYHDLKNILNHVLDSLPAPDRQVLLQGNTFDTIAVHRKIQAIEVNMERWREELTQLNNPYVWINIPAFMLYVEDGEHNMLASKVIVGKPDTPTPMLSSVIDCFTIYPFWYVPRKIATEEFLPEIKKDTIFLHRNNFDVLDKKGDLVDQSKIDWKIYNKSNFPFVLRQREGRGNSLGIIKFSFDNPYAVYLHDTNNNKLFDAQVRAFSHGCIRLEKAVELAHFLVRSEEGHRQIDRAILLKKRETMEIIPPISIYVRYFTCEVKDGRLVQYPDIYKLDEKFRVLLYQ